nr:hypothetical protein [Tanacetum cinerariifolium]
MEAIQAFLKKYDQIPSEEKCIALLRYEEKFLKVKQALKEEKNQPEIRQELRLQLIHDLQLLNQIQPKQAEEKGINKQVQKKQKEKSIAELLAEEQAARINSLFQDHIEEHEDSLIMDDEDINTIPEKESDEENESSVENLFHIPSKFEVTFDNENLPFDFDEESISSDVNPIYDEVLEDIDGTNYIIGSIIYSSKIDPLLEEFADEIALINPIPPGFDEINFDHEENIHEIALINPIPPGFDEINFDHEENIRLIEKLLYDNLSPRPPKELNSKISIDSFSLYPIPSRIVTLLWRRSILFLLQTTQYHRVLIVMANDSKEVNFFLEYEPDPGELTRVVVEDIFKEPRVRVPNVLPTYPTFFGFELHSF